MDPQPAESTDSKPPRIVIVLVLVVLAIIGYAFWPHTSNVPTANKNTATSTTPAETTTASPKTQTTLPVPTKPPNAPVNPVTLPALSADYMTASVKEGTVPFDTNFTLTLNNSRNCSTITYVLDFGDAVKKEVQVPTTQCGKIYSTVINHQYQRAGNFTATLSTKPSIGTGQVVASIGITSRNPSKTVGNSVASFTISPLAGTSPLTVDFSLSAGDSTSSAVRYTAIFGDGESAPFARTTSPTLSHVYTSSGAFVVTISRQTECTAVQCIGPTSPVGTYSINVN